MLIKSLLLTAVLVGSLATRGFSAPVNVAIDIDSTHTFGDFPIQPITTQVGFTSWDLSGFNLLAHDPITVQNVTFEVVLTETSPPLSQFLWLAE